MEPFGPLGTGFAHPVGASDRDWSYGQQSAHSKSPESKDRETRPSSGGGRAAKVALQGRACAAPLVTHASCSRRACKLCRSLKPSGTACKRRSGRFRSLSNIPPALTLLKGRWNVFPNGSRQIWVMDG